MDADDTDAINPIVRIFHISDLHCGPPTSVAWRRIANTFHPVLPDLHEGTAVWDQGAQDALKDSIIQAAGRLNPQWRGRAVLAVTGDLTTWGDDASVQEARAFAEDLARMAQLLGPVFLYGNHDVWPERPNSMFGLPLSNPPWTLDQRRSQLRTRFFKHNWLHNHTPVLGSRHFGASFGLYGVNTVLHGPNDNTRALGKVQHDWYWEKTRRAARDQIVQLEDELRDKDISVVLTHHPVHDDVHPHVPGSVAPRRMVLENSDKLANTLRSGVTPARDRVRLVLSGHTHKTFPPAGDLPEFQPPPASQGCYLDGNCVQLTAGTATQGISTTAPEWYNQEWQIVGVSVRGANEVLVDRIVMRRPHGIGSFDAVSDEADPTKVSEPMTLYL